MDQAKQTGILQSETFRDAFVIRRPEGLGDEDWKVLAMALHKAFEVGAKWLYVMAEQSIKSEDGGPPGMVN